MKLKKIKLPPCPQCRSFSLEVDLEYMQKHYGEAYDLDYIPNDQVVYWCSNHQDGGTLDEIKFHNAILVEELDDTN